MTTVLSEISNAAHVNTDPGLVANRLRPTGCFFFRLSKLNRHPIKRRAIMATVCTVVLVNRRSQGIIPSNSEACELPASSCPDPSFDMEPAGLCRSQSDKSQFGGRS